MAYLDGQVGSLRGVQEHPGGWQGVVQRNVYLCEHLSHLKGLINLTPIQEGGPGCRRHPFDHYIPLSPRQRDPQRARVGRVSAMDPKANSPPPDEGSGLDAPQ